MEDAVCFRFSNLAVLERPASFFTQELLGYNGERFRDRLRIVTAAPGQPVLAVDARDCELKLLAWRIRNNRRIERQLRERSWIRKRRHNLCTRS